MMDQDSLDEDDQDDEFEYNNLEMMQPSPVTTVGSIKRENEDRQQQRILDQLQKIKDKKLMEQKLKQEKLEKEKIQKEKLQQKILKQAQKHKEEKEEKNKQMMLEMADQLELQRKLEEEKAAKKREKLEKQMLNQQQIQEEEKEKKKKFKMRHENYIKSLTENIKLKEEEKELDKEKLDIKKALLKEQLWSHVNSRLTEPTLAVKVKQVEKVEKKKRSNSDEKEKQKVDKTKQKEINQIIYQKQLENINKIKEKKYQDELEKQQQIQKKEQLQQKLQEVVLTRLKEQTGVLVRPIRSKSQENFDEQEQPTAKPEKKQKKEDPNALRIYPFVVDFATWKKKQRLDQNTKVFIILGGYKDLKKALIQRGDHYRLIIKYTIVILYFYHIFTLIKKIFQIQSIFKKIYEFHQII